VTLILESPQSLKEFIGREIALTDWFPITQEQIDRFAEVTKDQQWIHLHRERAQRDSPYGTTIAHGFLTLSLFSHFMREALQIRDGTHMTINYGLNRVRFPAPVLANSRIRARFAVQSVREVPGAVEAIFNITIETDSGEKPCCVAEWVLLHCS
jgi:acyl dehydratase